MSTAIPLALSHDFVSTVLEDALVSIVDSLDVPQAALFLARDLDDPRRPGGWYAATRGHRIPTYTRWEAMPQPLHELDAATSSGRPPRASLRMPSWIRGRYAALVVPIRGTAGGALLGLLYLARGPHMSLSRSARDAATRAGMRVARALERASALQAAETAGRDEGNRTTNHELASALSAILLLSELIEDDPRLPPDVQQDIRTIEEAAVRAGAALRARHDDRGLIAAPRPHGEGHDR